MEYLVISLSKVLIQKIRRRFERGTRGHSLGTGRIPSRAPQNQLDNPYVKDKHFIIDP
jgi:hypothetical protein